jgi:hypothetical protein
MSYQDRLTSPGPARDDPELGDTTTPTASGAPASGAPGGGAGSGGPSATDRAKDTAATGKDKAQEVAQTATDQAKDVASTAKGEASQVARTAQGQARRLAHDTRHELRSQANSQMERVASGLGDLSSQLRTMGERGDPGPVSDLAGEAAFRAEQFADRLRQGGVEDAVNSVKRFGRNRPGLFLLGAFGVGLAAGRIVRNLAEDPTGGDSNGSVERPRNGNGYGYGADELTGAQGALADPTRATADPYGAPATYAEPYGAPEPAPGERPVTPGTAPVGDQRWGS